VRSVSASDGERLARSARRQEVRARERAEVEVPNITLVDLASRSTEGVAIEPERPTGIPIVLQKESVLEPRASDP
jgi:hypothetical protein